MQWQPQEEPLRQLAGYLDDSLGANKERREHAGEMLHQAKASPDICNYLCYMTVTAEFPPSFQIPAARLHTIRQSAAVSLKNNIRESWQRLAQPNQAYIKQTILLGLSDEHPQIRSITGNVISEIVRTAGLLQWADILSTLITMVETGPTPKVKEAAIVCLAGICEDNKKSLGQAYNGEEPLNFLIPKFLEFTSSEIDAIRAYALGAINIFIPSKPKAILDNVDSILEVLTRLAPDNYEMVRRNVCRALVQIVDVRPDKIAPRLEGIIDYMIQQQSNDMDDELALEAAEFWLTLGEHDVLQKELGPYLPKIVPTLLKSMVYSEDDIENMGGRGDDADVEDKAEEIKVVFAKSKSRLMNGDPAEDGKGEAVKMSDDDELSEGEIEDDLFAGIDPEDKWNLRKCSAAALDVLAGVYHDTIFQTILPYLEKNISNPEWQLREASVLALGAVADGCWDTVTPHLPKLLPYLNTLLNDPEPLVRQITCWTLGRYSRWAAETPDKRQYFEPMMEGLLMKMLDNNKKVQEAGASAFAVLEEQAKAVLTPYMEPILRQFIAAMGRYKDRNMYILYDCIQTLAEHVGAAIAQQPAVDLLMPALIGRYNKVGDDNRELFPLLECLSFVAQAMGPNFQPYAGPIFFRCINIIHRNLEQAHRVTQNPELEEPNKDFLITSLDLLSAIIQALQGQSIELVRSARPAFFRMLMICLGDTNNEVKQSAYALLGDCAIYVFTEMHPHIPQILGILIEALDLTVADEEEDPDTIYSVINNACWSCGEIALQHSSGMVPYIDRLFHRLVAIIQAPNIPPSLTENAAITVGRLGLGCCEELAPHLATFAELFLHTLAKVQETDEKDTAFRGFVLTAGRNPQALEDCLKPFFQAIARYRHPSKQLHALFLDVIRGYQTAITDWPGFVGTLSAGDQQKLRANYSV